MADLYEQDKDNLEFIKAKLRDIDKNITVPETLDASHLMKLLENEAAPVLTVHKTPVKWRRFASVAAAFVIIGGALAYAGLGGLTGQSGAPMPAAAPAAAQAANDTMVAAEDAPMPQLRAFSGDMAVAAEDDEALYAQSYEQIRAAMKEAEAEPNPRIRASGEGATEQIALPGEAAAMGGPSPDIGVETNADSGGGDVLTGGGGFAAEVYTTNAQTAGIDEADIVKTNGESIFYLYTPQENEKTGENAYPLVKIVDAETLTVASTIDFPSDTYASDMFLSGDKLAVIYNDYNFATTPKYTLYEDGWEKTGERSVRATTLRVYNVADTKNPVSERSFSQQGRYVSSRLKDDTVYLVTNTSANSAYCDKYKDIDLVPLLKDSAVSSVARAMPAKNIFIPQAVNSARYTVLSSVNLNYPVQTTTKALLGAGEAVYMADNAIYVTGATRVEFPAEISTSLLKFDVAGGGIRFWAQGIVPGEIDGQFALDESAAGELRIATTRRTYKNPSAAKTQKEKQIRERAERNKLRSEWTEKYEKAKEENRGEQFLAENPKPWINSAKNAEEPETKAARVDPYEQIVNNNLYVLDAYLNKIGEVTGLAQGESIKSVRYIGDMAYVVTFKQVDPLFAIDLSNPQSPRVLGQLKIPGFSEYLHPIDENTLLGLGYDTEVNEDGSVYTNGIKLSLFDVSSPQSPREIKSIKIAGEGGSSQALYTHQAFMWYAKEGIAGVPLVTYKDGGEAQAVAPGEPSEGTWRMDFNGLALFRVSSGELEPLARLSQTGGSDGIIFVGREAPVVERGIYIGDSIYLLSPAGITKFALDTMQKTGEVLFA